MEALTKSLIEFINPNLKGLHESDTLAINERSKALISRGKNV